MNRQYLSIVCVCALISWLSSADAALTKPDVREASKVVTSIGVDATELAIVPLFASAGVEQAEMLLAKSKKSSSTSRTKSHKAKVKKPRGKKKSAKNKATPAKAKKKKKK